MSEHDRASLDAYLRGDVRAFEALVSRYEGPLLGYAERMLGDGAAAQDAVQETFLRLIREGRTIDHGETIGTWLFRVCRNAGIDAARKEGRMRSAHEKAAHMQAEAAPGPDPVERREAQQALREELEKLPVNQRNAVVLKVQQGKSYREISAITGLSESNVGYLIHHGLRNLAHGLKAAGVI